MKHTEFLQIRQSFVHASSQLGPPGKLILGTRLEEFRLRVQNLSFEFVLLFCECWIENPQIHNVELGKRVNLKFFEL